MNPDELANRVAHGMLAAEGTGPAWGIRIEEARAGYARLSMRVRADMLNGRNEKTVAAQAGIVFLGSAGEAETLIADAEEVAREGRTGVTRVSVKTAEARDIAEFTGYSRTIGGAVVDI